MNSGSPSKRETFLESGNLGKVQKKITWASHWFRIRPESNSVCGPFSVQFVLSIVVSREAEGVDQRVDESIKNGGIVSNGEDSRSSSALSHNVETRDLRGSMLVCLSENRENLIPRATQSSRVNSCL